eukprot:6200384-Pleurochrysis_carterae.AAC.5
MTAMISLAVQREAASEAVSAARPPVHTAPGTPPCRDDADPGRATPAGRNALRPYSKATSE